MNKVLKVLAIVSLFTCTTATATLPQLPTISQHIRDLQTQLNDSKLDPQKERTTQHELHRLLFIAYLLRYERSKQEVRVDAHHAFSTLYHAQSSDKLKLRDLLSSFVKDLYELRITRLSTKDHAEAVLARAAQLEEMVMPLLKDSPRGQDALFVFTKRMYQVMVKPRLTRNHYIAIFSLLGMGAITTWALLMLLKQMVNSAQRADTMVENITTFAKSGQKLLSEDGQIIAAALANNASKAPPVIRWLASRLSSREDQDTSVAQWLQATLDEIKSQSTTGAAGDDTRP